MTDSPTLLIERTGEPIARITETVDVGRSPDAGIVISGDPHVSSRHFRLHRRGSEWWVIDLESRNGTFLNDQPVQTSVIRTGDRIVAGETTFLVAFDVPESEREPSADALVDTAERTALSLPAGPIFNSTPFAVGTVYHENTSQSAWLTIVIKATWTIERTPKPAANQIPIFTGDQLEGDDPTASIRFESDLAPFKPRADVVLVGHAHAPAGEPVTELVAGLRVGGLRHVVSVVGDRVWQWLPNGAPTISRPRPFTSMPLAYERAFGGIDGPAALYCQENLVGTGFIGKITRERVDGLRLPNLEDPGNLITSCDTHPTPVGFGFYGRGWRPRLRYAGTYDDGYVMDRHPLPPLDFSYEFFNGAHPDLQVDGYLAGDEEVALVNVCPGEPDARFRLPGIVPKVAVSRYSVPLDQWIDSHPDDPTGADAPVTEEEISTVLDTLVFIPDDGVFYQLFRGRCRLASLDSLEIARIAVTV